MENAFEHMDELIAKYLAGECRPDEAAQIDAWRKAAGENDAYFMQSRHLVEMVSFNVNTDAAWNALNQRISANNNEAVIIPLHRRPVFVRAAAAVLFLAVLGVVISSLLSTTAPLVLVASATPVQQALPDGSQVRLNPHTELSYEAGKHGERKVVLKGEAFFEVVHDAKKPFVVSVNEVMIRDIGTAFNVKATPGDNVVEVEVESGEVQFYSEVNQGLVLRQGEKAIYNLGSKQFIKANITAAETKTETKKLPDPVTGNTSSSLKTNQLSFKGTPLRVIIAQINSIYSSEIRLADETLGDERMSVAFDDQSLNTVVGIITETFDLESERKGDSIILKRKSQP